MVWLDGFFSGVDRRGTLLFKPGGDSRDVLSETLLEFLSKLSRFQEKLVILVNCDFFFMLRRNIYSGRVGAVL